MVKPAVWVASARKDVRAFPDDARARAGYEVYRVQMGLDPTDWKPMVSIGDGVREIRVRTGREHRLIYVAKLAEAVFVLHAFEKKSQKTTRADLDLARDRYRDLLAQRAAKARRRKNQ
jgi:phage-related protein